MRALELGPRFREEIHFLREGSHILSYRPEVFAKKTKFFAKDLIFFAKDIRSFAIGINFFAKNISPDLKENVALTAGMPDLRDPGAVSRIDAKPLRSKLGEEAIELDPGLNWSGRDI